MKINTINILTIMLIHFNVLLANSQIVHSKKIEQQVSANTNNNTDKMALIKSRDSLWQWVDVAKYYTYYSSTNKLKRTEQFILSEEGQWINAIKHELNYNSLDSLENEKFYIDTTFSNLWQLAQKGKYFYNTSNIRIDDSIYNYFSNQSQSKSNYLYNSSNQLITKDSYLLDLSINPTLYQYEKMQYQYNLNNNLYLSLRQIAFDSTFTLQDFKADTFYYAINNNLTITNTGIYYDSLWHRMLIDSSEYNNQNLRTELKTYAFNEDSLQYYLSSKSEFIYDNVGQDSIWYFYYGNDDGALDTNTIYIWSSITSRIKPISNKNEFSMYPNPGNIQLNIQGTNSNTIVTFYNSNGSLVFESKLQSTNTEINTSSFRGGIYYYQFKNSEGIILQSGKWVKE